MKRLLFISIITILIISCKSNDVSSTLNPIDIVPIRPSLLVSAQSGISTARKITDIHFYNYSISENHPVGYGLSSFSVDTLTPSINMRILDFMDKNGVLNGPLSKARDVVFRRTFLIKYGSNDTIPYNLPTTIITQQDRLISDTIAYIPNSTLIKGLSKIESAYFDGNYDECTRLFQTEFTFIPISGYEWRKLKAENNN